MQTPFILYPALRPPPWVREHLLAEEVRPADFTSQAEVVESTGCHLGLQSLRAIRDKFTFIFKLAVGAVCGHVVMASYLVANMPRLGILARSLRAMWLTSVGRCLAHMCGSHVKNLKQVMVEQITWMRSGFKLKWPASCLAHPAVFPECGDAEARPASGGGNLDK